MSVLKTRLSRRLWRGKDGGAAVEFALLVPVLVLLTMGAVDLGLAAYERMQLEAAARVGVQYVLQTNTNETATITSVVQNAAEVSPVAVSVAFTYECDGVEVPSGTACSNGLARYVQVSVTKSFAPLIDVAGIAPDSLSASAQIRTQ